MQSYLSFNPLDRGNLNQIDMGIKYRVVAYTQFQSPRSGKFESNSEALAKVAEIEAGLVSIP